MFGQDHLRSYFHELEGYRRNYYQNRDKDSEEIKKRERYSNSYHNPRGNAHYLPEIPQRYNKENYTKSDLLVAIDRIESRIQRLSFERKIQSKVNEKILSRILAKNHNWKSRVESQSSLNLKKSETSIKPAHQSKTVSKKEQKEQKESKKYLKKFRIVAFAVYFSIIFPKFSKFVTKRRFQEFKEDNKIQIEISRIENNLNKEIYDLSFQSEYIQKFIDLKVQVSKKGEIGLMFAIRHVQFFIIKLMKQLSLLFLRESFYDENSILQSFHNKQFIKDQIVDEQDMRHLNFHPQKGYSQHSQEVTQYLLTKFLFLEIFLKQKIIEKCFDKMVSETQEDIKSYLQSASLSIQFREKIIRNIIKEFLEFKKKDLKVFPVPKKELLPFPAHKMFEKEVIFLKERDFVIEKETIQEMTESLQRKLKTPCFMELNKVYDYIGKKIPQIWKQNFMRKKKVYLEQRWEFSSNFTFQYHSEEEYEQFQKKENQRIEEEQKSLRFEVDSTSSQIYESSKGDRNSQSYSDSSVPESNYQTIGNSSISKKPKTKSSLGVSRIVSTVKTVQIISSQDSQSFKSFKTEFIDKSSQQSMQSKQTQSIKNKKMKGKKGTKLRK